MIERQPDDGRYGHEPDNDEIARHFADNNQGYVNSDGSYIRNGVRYYVQSPESDGYAGDYADRFYYDQEHEFENDDFDDDFNKEFYNFALPDDDYADELAEEEQAVESSEDEPNCSEEDDDFDSYNADEDVYDDDEV